MKTKICTKCGKRKKVSEFWKEKRASDGLNCWCKECCKAQKHEYYLEHQEEIKARTKKYREDNKDYYSEYNKEYREKNKDKLEERRKKNADKIREQKRKLYFDKIKENPDLNKERYALNKDKYAIWNRNSHKKNRLKNNKRSNEYAKRKRQEDIGFKLLCALRIRMYDVLKGRTKSDTTKNLLGCSIEDFKKHLESQFKEGMTWKNHGRKGWHIDHIQQCCTFDLTNEDEQRKCFHYSNLRPLWAEENLKRPKQT